MRKNLFTRGLLVLAAGIVVSSCEPAAESKNRVTYQLKPANFTASVGASVSGSGLIVALNTASSITWEEGTLNIQEIDFEAKKDGNAVEYEYKQLANVNLSGASALGSVTLPDGTYDEVELKLEFKKSATAPIRLKGTYTDLSGAKTPIELQLNEDLEIEVKAEDLVVEADDHLARINMELNKLLANISISDLTMATKTNGTVVINSTSNTGIYAKMKASLNAFAHCDFDN